MKSSVSKKAGTVLVFLADLVATSFCTVWMWNNIIARLFQVSEITIMQGWALSFAITYFIKGHGKIGESKERNWIMEFSYDIIYTILIWLMAFIITIFAF